MDTKNYIDTVVLTEKPQAAEAVPRRPGGPNDNVSLVNDVRLTRVGDSEVAALTFDENSEDGGDPYNSTGKHCVLKVKKD